MFQPEWHPDSGLACLRLGGLSPVRQDNLKAPVGKGLWSFIFPYWDWWFLSGKQSRDKFPKKELPKHLRPKPRKFYAQGIIYTLLEVPGADKINDPWRETTDKELFKFLSKQFAKDIWWLRQSERISWGSSSKQVAFKADISHPYHGSKGGYMSVDHLEVFIPAQTRIR